MSLMAAAFGCPFIAGPVCQGCDGSCWYPEPSQPEPTAEEYCAAMKHPVAAVDEHGVGWCHCGDIPSGASA